MRSAASLFDIDQEPLFEASAVDAGAEVERGGGEAVEAIPRAADASVDLSGARVDQSWPRSPWRVRLLLAAGAIGAAGFLGSRLTSDSPTPSASRGTASDVPALVTAAPASRPSPKVPPGLEARRQRTNPPRRRRRGGARRVGRAARRPKVNSASALAPADSQVSRPVPIPPPTQRPAPEPQGFSGEFF